jgi:L-seryl-tRNA(Ser) seleniumtransferase
MLTRPHAQIQALATAIAPFMRLAVAPRFEVEVVEMLSQIGSGSLPVDRLPSAGLALAPSGTAKRGRGTALEGLHAALRDLPQPVIGRIAEDRLMLDLRCLENSQALLGQLDALKAMLRDAPS